MDIKLLDDSRRGLEDIEMYKNWRNSLANPKNPIRIGNTKIKINNVFLVSILSLIVFLIFFIYLKPDNSNNVYNAASGSSYVESEKQILYDKTYPLSKPLVLNGQKIFKLGEYRSIFFSFKKS